mmetsp:Transcript_11352/g.11307  ORF Transcript_11352/g.11307 Transcript_11352/m.11307 type:complete len:89 (+) Transcript_11352:576-842(+)
MINFDIDNLTVHVSKLIKDMPNAIKDCPQLTIDFPKVFTKWIKKLVDIRSIPVMIFKAALNYRQRIWKAANALVYNWRSLNFEQSGFE